MVDNGGELSVAGGHEMADKALSHRAILENRAALAGDDPSEHDCPNCDGDLIFALRDRHHAFSLDLPTILQCLHMAEAEGAVPELPPEWWGAVRTRYTFPHRD